MTLLLDTHAALWWWIDSQRISPNVRRKLDERQDDVFVSAVAAYELAGKYALGKLPEAAGVIGDLYVLLQSSAFTPLPVSMEHARVAGLLPGPHRDPFDRLLIAQAKIENATVVSADPVFAAYGVPVLW